MKKFLLSTLLLAVLVSPLLGFQDFSERIYQQSFNGFTVVDVARDFDLRSLPPYASVMGVEYNGYAPMQTSDITLEVNGRLMQTEYISNFQRQYFFSINMPVRAIWSINLRLNGYLFLDRIRLFWDGGYGPGPGPAPMPYPHPEPGPHPHPYPQPGPQPQPQPYCNPQTQPYPHWGMKSGMCLPSCGTLAQSSAIASNSSCSSQGLIDAGLAYDVRFCCRSVCDPHSQPSPDWGVKNGQCLKSCGGLGGKQAFNDSCSKHGMQEVGIAYDVPHCCR